MRLLIFMIATFSFPSIAKANCKDTDIVGAVVGVETGTTAPVMIIPMSEISSYKLTEGFGILANSEIVTDATSSVKILFTDGTSLSVGSNSRIKIDQYVFSCEPGRVTEQMLKGFLRVISGRMKQQQPNLQGFSSGGVRG